MKFKKKQITIIFLVISLLVAFFSQQTTPKKIITSKAQTPTVPFIRITPDWKLAQMAHVVRVVDGDTIEIIANGSSQKQTLRYIGIDTPETVHPKKAVQCYGHEASTKNKELVEGKNVYMLRDVSDTDRYGRLLRYIYLKDPMSTESGLFVNEYLVKEGYAYAATFPPDVAYQQLFSNSQKEAMQQKKGLWSSCSAR